MNFTTPQYSGVISPVSARWVLRVDPYGPVHKALRSHMQGVLTRVGNLDVTNPSEVETTLGSLLELFEDLGEHVTLENSYLHPALENANLGIAERAASDHSSHERSLGALLKASDELRRRVSLGFLVEAQSMARSLYLHLSCFVAEKLEHMHHEETDLLKQLWLSYDDEELGVLCQQVLEQATLPHLRRNLQWMLFALNPRERIGAVAMTKRHLTSERLRQLLEDAEQTMQSSEFVAFAGAISESAL